MTCLTMKTLGLKPEISDETMDSASNLFARASSPYWDWRTEEEGGIAAVAESFKEERSRGARWILARSKRDDCSHILLLGESSSGGPALPQVRWQDRG